MYDSTSRCTLLRSDWSGPQDELASVCRRARPVSSAEVSSISSGPAAWDLPHSSQREGEKQAKSAERSRGWAKGAQFLQAAMGCGPSCDVIEDTVRDFNAPDDPAKAALACPFLPEYICPVLRRRLVGRRILAGANAADRVDINCRIVRCSIALFNYE